MGKADATRGKDAWADTAGLPEIQRPF